MKPILRFAFFVLAIQFHLCAQTSELKALEAHFKDPAASDSARFWAGTDYLKLQVRSDLLGARATGESLLSMAQNADNNEWKSVANRYLGNTYAMQGLLPEAKEYFVKSYGFLKILDDPSGLALTANNIGTVYYEMGLYPQAQDYLLESLRIAEKFDDDNSAALATNNLGNVHNDWRNNEKALEYYLKSLKIKKRLGDEYRIAAAYNNIGLVHMNEKRYDSAIYYLEESAQIAKKLDDLQSMTRAFINLGSIHAQKQEYAKALSYQDTSVQIKIDINDEGGLAQAYLNRGQTYLAMNRFENARNDCMSSLKITEAISALNAQKEACQCIGRALEGLADYKGAVNYFKRYETIKDSLFNKEKTQEQTRKELNYTFAKKQLADSIAFHKLQSERQVAYEKDLNREQKKFYLTLLIALGILGFMGFLYWRYRQNLKVKDLENDLLTTELDYKEKDLTNLAVNISNNQEWAESLAEKLDGYKKAEGKSKTSALKDLETEIKNKIWVHKGSDEFYNKIDSISTAFYDKLSSQFESLTKNDIRLCSLIKLDLNTKQIATLQNINPASVKMSRNRLRKKLNLSPNDDLSAFLRTF
ncbi:MAG: tetratricopeptide repeat protein [Bacteroidota bacterium]